MSRRQADPECACKIGKNIKKYNLVNLNSELIQRREDQQASLRDLADFINKQILKSALESVNADITSSLYTDLSGGNAIVDIYNVLTDDDIPTDRVARIHTRLSQAGVDLESIKDDWVTHPTIRTHFQKCLNIDTSRTSNITDNDAQDTIEWARSKCAKIVEQTFQRLRNANVVSTGPVTATVVIKVTCERCGATARPTNLIRSRSCECTSEKSSSISE